MTLRASSARALRAWAGAALLAALGACATPQPPAGAQPGCGLDVGGRISVVEQGTHAYSLYGSFELRLDGAAGSLQLGSPLGQTLALARWDALSARVDDGRSVRAYASFEDMTEATLGLRLPRAALQDWVRGRPAPQLPSRALPQGGFEQLGWQVRVQRADGQPHVLRLTRREGDESEQLALVIDRRAPRAGACDEAEPSP